MSTFGKDDGGTPPPDYNAKQRKAAQEWVKEHPGELAIQGGELAGIDRDTGEDIIETNKKLAEQKWEALKALNYILQDKGPLLPDGFKGIEYDDATWQEAQLHCRLFGRSDLDYNLPQDLPPDILADCHEITLEDDGFQVIGKDSTVIYQCDWELRDYIISVKRKKR